MIDEKKRIGKFDCRVISSKKAGPAMIFLHGYMFTSEIWDQIGMLAALEEKDISFTALDMPYGHHSDCEPKSPAPEDNIDVVKEMAGQNDILVGASMGGNIALHYAVDHPVGGLVLIAPVRSLSEDLVNKYKDANFPVLIIYGENDAIVPKNEMEALSGKLNAPLHVYENAGHPAYQDLPDRFISDVVAFYQKLFK